MTWIGASAKVPCSSVVRLSYNAATASFSSALLETILPFTYSMYDLGARLLLQYGENERRAFARRCPSPERG